MVSCGCDCYTCLFLRSVVIIDGDGFINSVMKETYEAFWKSDILAGEGGLQRSRVMYYKGKGVIARMDFPTGKADVAVTELLRRI